MKVYLALHQHYIGIAWAFSYLLFLVSMFSLNWLLLRSSFPRLLTGPNPIVEQALKKGAHTS